MNNIEYKVQTLIEKRDFDKLTPAEREMVYTVMTEEEYSERREFLLKSESLFSQERELLQPDVQILNSLKEKIQKESRVEEGIDKGAFYSFLTYKVSLAKSIAATLLLLVSSYFVFNNRDPELQFVEKKVVVEKKIHDTVYAQKVVEVPVEKIVKVVEYKQIPTVQRNPSVDVSFAVKELEAKKLSKKVELKELNKSFGNSKIDEAELEQFRVSL